MAYSVTLTRLTVELLDDGEQVFEASSVIVADNGLLDLATPDGPVTFEDGSWTSVTITPNRGELSKAPTA